MADPATGETATERAAAVLAEHQRVVVQPGHPCYCGQWPTRRAGWERVGYHEHVAEALAAADLLAATPGEGAAATIEALAVEAESWPDDEDDAGGAVADWLRSRIPPNPSPAGSPAPTMDPSERANGGAAVVSRTGTGPAGEAALSEDEEDREDLVQWAAMNGVGLGPVTPARAGAAEPLRQAVEALESAADVLDADEEVAFNVVLGGPSYVAYWLRERAAALRRVLDDTTPEQP